MSQSPSNSLPPTTLPAPHKRKHFATSTLSMLVSVVLHTALLALAAAVVWHTAIAPPHPAASLLTLESPGDAAPSRGTPSATQPYRPPASHEIVIETIQPAPSPNAAEPLRGLANAPDPASPAPSPATTASLTASSLVSALGAAEPAAGDRTNTAVPGVSDGPASVTFAGLGASGVKSVVYVVDCSGPMVTSLPIVIAELERSIAHLSPTQKFGVILFRRTSDTALATESFAPVLVRPTASARTLLHEWLAHVEPTGRSSPLAGLEAALALRPDAVFLLSRAIQRSGGGVWDLGLDATMNRLQQLNPVTGNRRDVLIQTIQFLDEDPTGIMQAIGTQHGGGRGYRVIQRQQDLDVPSTTP